MSRQREWQKRKAAEGKCTICGKPRHHYMQRCDSCYAEDSERRKRRRALLRQKATTV